MVSSLLRGLVSAFPFDTESVVSSPKNTKLLVSEAARPLGDWFSRDTKGSLQGWDCNFKPTTFI